MLVGIFDARNPTGLFTDLSGRVEQASFVLLEEQCPSLCSAQHSVLAPFAVDQAACLRADGEQRVDSSASSDSVGWTVTDTCTTATKIRRVRPPAVKMSRNAKRWLTRPACIAGVGDDR